MAKRLLNNRQVPFDEIDVSFDADARRWLVDTTGQRTVPQIFIGGQSIGGYTELRALERTGELDRMLEADHD